MPVDPAAVPPFLGPLLEISGPANANFDLRIGRPLPVSMPPQALTNWCWAATTAAIKAFYHERDAKPQCEVATFWLNLPCCPPGPDVQDNPQNRQYNLATTLGANLAGAPLGAPAEPDELLSEIVEGHPVCCMIRWSNGKQHFNVIADYLGQSGEVVVRDPMYGDAQLPYAEFRDRYRHEGRWIATLKTKRTQGVAIISVPSPVGAREVVAATLGARLGVGRLEGFRGPLSLTVGVPRLALPSIRWPRLSRAQVVGWDFLVLGGEEVALASARIADGAAVFTGITRGEFAARVLAATIAGADALDPAPAVYRPVFVESGAAAAFAMIFKPDRGPAFYVDILDGRLLDKKEIVVRTGVGALLDRIGELGTRRVEPATQAPGGEGLAIE